MADRLYEVTVGVVAVMLLVMLAAVAAGQRREFPVLGAPTRGDELTTTAHVRRVLFELRLAEPEPVRGLTFEGTVKNTDRKIYLHYTVVISNSDIQNASVVENAGRFEVALTLGPEGAGKMMAATSRHLGRPLAIILDGELVAALTVREALGARVVFGANFTAADATRIAAGLDKW